MAYISQSPFQKFALYWKIIVVFWFPFSSDLLQRVQLTSHYWFSNGFMSNRDKPLPGPMMTNSLLHICISGYSFPDYPLCTLDKPVHQLLVRTLNMCSTKTLELFFEHCMQSMINDMGKGNYLQWEDDTACTLDNIGSFLSEELINWLALAMCGFNLNMVTVKSLI